MANLLDPDRSRGAERLLEQIGLPAVPALVTASHDPRYWAAITGRPMVPSPLDAILELLVPYAADDVIAAATPLTVSRENEVRKTAGIHLASLGRADTVNTLTPLLGDPDGYVRAYVCMGIRRAIEAGRADKAFRDGLYAQVFEQCDVDWTSSLNDAAECLIEIDRERAEKDFGNSGYLSSMQFESSRLMAACNRAGVKLPDTELRMILERELPRAVGEHCYPHDYVATEALQALARSSGHAAKPTLEAASEHPNEKVRAAAAAGIAFLADVHDPFQFVIDVARTVGFAGLSEPQKVVYCGFMFDAEVCNGGLTQFFANSSGDHAADTLRALETLGHPTAILALSTAIQLIGPASQMPGADQRLAAFEGRYDELRSAFEPLESEFYKDTEELNRRLFAFAARHAEHFRRP